MAGEVTVGLQPLGLCLDRRFAASLARDRQRERNRGEDSYAGVPVLLAYNCLRLLEFAAGCTYAPNRVKKYASCSLRSWSASLPGGNKTSL
jgi:hypothetical protein